MSEENTIEFWKKCHAGEAYKVNELYFQLSTLQKERDELLAVVKEFVEHYDTRKITNGFHDLLANKAKKALRGA